MGWLTGGALSSHITDSTVLNLNFRLIFLRSIFIIYSFIFMMIVKRYWSWHVNMRHINWKIIIVIVIVVVIVIVIVIVIVGLAAFSDSYFFYTGSSTNISPSPTTAVPTSSWVTISPPVMVVLSTKITSKNLITKLSMASLTSMSSSGFVVTTASEPEVVVSSLARLVPNTGRSALTFSQIPARKHICHSTSVVSSCIKPE